MQPHIPFVGKIKLGHGGQKNVLAFARTGKAIAPPGCVWTLLEENKLNVNDVIEAYESNLTYVLESVEKLLPELHGKVVVTSDHGQCFGEHDTFGHPGGKDFPELLTVPWLEVTK